MQASTQLGTGKTFVSSDFEKMLSGRNTGVAINETKWLILLHFSRKKNWKFCRNYHYSPDNDLMMQKKWKFSYMLISIRNLLANFRKQSFSQNLFAAFDRNDNCHAFLYISHVQITMKIKKVKLMVYTRHATLENKYIRIIIFYLKNLIWYARTHNNFIYMPYEYNNTKKIIQ